MVLDVCERLLRNRHDAEDAFQATFLILARKAGSVARPALLGNWLYGVAYRTALKALARITGRRAKESQAVRAVAADADAVWADLRPVLDEEVSRLSDKFRAPFVLCYLQGRTNEEAAHALGCPKGTVLSRLATARARLRSRLTRRGIALSAALVAAALSEGVASAAVPPPLAGATAKAAVGVAASQGATGLASARAIALANAVSRDLLLRRLSVLTAGVLAAAALVASGAFLALRGTGDGDAVQESVQGGMKEQNDAPRLGLKELEGDWNVASVTQGDWKFSHDELKGMRWTIQGSEMATTNAGEKPAGAAEAGPRPAAIGPQFADVWCASCRRARVRTNPGPSPGLIDLTVLEGDLKGQTIEGIYQLQGDRLTVCLGLEKRRPTEFPTDRVSGRGVIAFEMTRK